MVITYTDREHKNLLDNKQWRVVDSIKHCEKRLTLSKVVFVKGVVSHSNNY